ncbi:unnamed protein product [marine sediment metagenome]|uniref:Uncharacterized protein n=1 Tax=marine sediment metagenome TaxID=412755 RepID=X1RWJ6_9ZZZZ
MGYAVGPDNWQSWLNVHLIVPLIHEFAGASALVATIIVAFILVVTIKRRRKKELH